MGLSTGLCDTGALSAPSLSEQLALVAADPALAGHPVVAGLVTLVDQQATELAALREAIVDLRRQRDRHSGNSGQPPSQDGPSAPPRTRRRRRSRGRQPGPAGTTRSQVASEQVAVHVDHWPDRCRGCGAALPRIAAGAPARRQMPDLPDPPPLVVTEHRAQAVCGPGCRTRTRAAFPAAVAGPVQFGPRLEAWVAYLRYAQHLPVACRDETGLRVAGALRWLPVSCDDRFTYYRLGARSAIWTEYVGIAVHDRLASYGTRLSDETAHGVCNAHLLRNLEAIVELEKAPDGWAAAMQTLLREARDTAGHACDTTGGPVPEPVRRATAAAWDALLAPVLDHYESLPPPACGRHRGHNLALALWTLRDACLLFLADPRVPFTNNRAEQALRMAKPRMKISGGFRTPAGAERFARMRGLIETARKQGHNLLDLLRLEPQAPVPWPDPVPP